mmetsp:Transcript_6149/g.9884  ORF Transcript_6149/g.9884 Transcript_6149/m.9884 type:complete len:90 (+) Transcript_6149:1639-1908(+)
MKAMVPRVTFDSKVPEYEEVITDISFRKCMTMLNEFFKHVLEQQAAAIYEGTIVRKLPTYLKKLAEMYPSQRDLIVDLTLRCFPHKEKP